MTDETQDRNDGTGKHMMEIVITVEPNGMVNVKGTINDEIPTLGLIEKARQVLIKHYERMQARIVKPGAIPFPLPPGMKVPH